ncbi:MAG TPA: tripartite tricarboxylate transporter permease [Candidatus Nanoarchaeia archaeon]|nr:tripartite tricarboxylate transporter permease [Candidatus Nanoarchaeia archaeon]
MEFISILTALLLGLFSGLITGITPGIHVNLVTVLLLSFSSLLLQITSPLVLAAYIISLAITHTFLDTLPSIYLGAPDEGKALSVLPGHRLLHQGLGHQAIAYTLIGSFGSLLLSIILFPLFVVSMNLIAPVIEDWIGFLLIAIMAYMILKEKNKKLNSLAVFLLSGILGLLVLSGIPNLTQPLFPLLSGLFGCSILLLSLLQKAIIPPQATGSQLIISTKNMAKSVSAATGVGFLAAFLPGFGSSQAAIVATNVVGDLGDEGFLSLVGGINTANMLISIGTIYALDKARNGAIVAVSQLLEQVNLNEVLLFLAVALVAGGLSVVLTLNLSRIFSKYIAKVNYRRLVILIIGFITLLTFYFDGIIGLQILLTATALGLVASHLGVGKNHLMGCLIVPVILYFVI